MARVHRVYYLLQNGTISVEINLTTCCKQIFAQNKKEAEALSAFLQPHEIFAETRSKKDRILFVSKKALEDQGLNDHLFLGKRDGFKTEVVGIQAADLSKTIYMSLYGCRVLYVPVTVAIVGKIAETIFAGFPEGFNSGDHLAPLIVQCSVIPTHTTTEITLYTDARVLNTTLPAAEGDGRRVGPSDLRNSAIMRSISAAALEKANAVVGVKPGNPEHIKTQKKARNEMARELGFPYFRTELVIPFDAIKGKFTGHEIVNRKAKNEVKK